MIPKAVVTMDIQEERIWPKVYQVMESYRTGTGS